MSAGGPLAYIIEGAALACLILVVLKLFSNWMAGKATPDFGNDDLGDAFGPRCHGFATEPVVSALRVSIAIAGNDRDRRKLIQRGAATERAAPANKEVIARPHDGEGYTP